MRKEVVITGIGCITPMGNDPDTMWANVLAGKSGVGPITLFDATEFKTKFAAEVKDFSPEAHFGREARRMDRFSQFAVYASRQAIANSGIVIDANNRDRIGAVIGSGVGGITTIRDNYEILNTRGPGRVSPFLVPMMLNDSAGACVAIDLGIRGPNMAVVTACATGSNTIGEAAEVIRRGHAEVMLAGGSEAGLIHLAVAGLINITALSQYNENPQGASRPFDLNRDGFVVGEGSAIVVVESRESAEARGATILGVLTGYGITNDAYHISAPSETGEGAARCMRMALAEAGLAPENINYINAHGTSTVLNDKTETKAIKQVFGDHAYTTPISSTKSMHGHLLGASGSLEAIICLKILQSNILPPTINYSCPDPECDLDYIPNIARPVAPVQHLMSNSFGFGGHNATLIFSRYETKRREMPR